MIEHNYDIHGVLKLKIISNKDKDFMRDLNLPFSYFEVKSDIKPDIILNIGEFAPSNDGCYLVDHKFHVKDNYFYCKDTGGMGRWELEIQGLEKEATIINYNGKFRGPEALLYPELLPQDILLRPLIEYKLNKMGYFMTHAAGLSKGDKGLILAGRGSSFKTSLCMDLIRKSGYGFLGDERVIMHAGNVMSFPVHVKALDYKVNNLKGESFLESSKVRGILKYIDFVRHLHDDRPLNGLPLIDAAPLAAILFVSRTNKPGVTMHTIDAKETAWKIAINNESEVVKGHTFFMSDYGQYFYKYVLAYSFIFPENDLLRHWSSLMGNVENALKNTPRYELQIPKSYDEGVFRQVERLLSEL